MPQQFLNIGGLVALGFDPTGEFMLTITHSGRGVFRVGTWERLARDIELAYPDAGFGVGIGPIAGLRIPMISINYDTGELDAQTPDLAFDIHYAEGTVTIEPADPRSGIHRRHHLHESSVSKAIRGATKRSDITKRVTAHTFRHSFATHLIESGSDIRTVQELLGHSDVRTTMIYTHVLNRGGHGVRSPADFDDFLSE